MLDYAVLAQIEELDPGDESLKREMVRLFLSSVGPRMGVLERLLVADDFLTLKLEAHAIKSSGSFLGTVQLSSSARELEESCVRRDPARARESIRALTVEFAECARDLTQWCGAGGAAADPHLTSF